MTRPDKLLLNAVLESQEPGALETIANAIEAGADPNGICPDTSTMYGHVRGGNTLLTQSIHFSESAVAIKLLECGADPSLKDENGWTPWMASTMSDESVRHEIREALMAYGANEDGGHIGKLARAINNGDLTQTRALVKSREDFVALANFRVDLIGPQIVMRKYDMLEYLLENGMSPSSTNLTNAIHRDDAEAVRLLLKYGQPPERGDEMETKLMVAAGRGKLDIVQLLVDAGADVNRSADEKGEWTPSFYARRGGHTEVAEWLKARMDNEAVAQQELIKDERDPKYAGLYEVGTGGDGLTTDDLVEILKRWDEAWGIEIASPEDDGVVVKFKSVPSAPNASLFDDAVRLCDDIAETKEELARDLKKQQFLALWFD